MESGVTGFENAMPGCEDSLGRPEHQPAEEAKVEAKQEEGGVQQELTAGDPTLEPPGLRPGEQDRMSVYIAS